VSPRPYWKGYLKLSLVSCPIALHAACSSTERICFRQINRKTGNRLRQQLVDEETREAVEAHDKARGYEIGKGQYLLVEDQELEAIEIASTHTIDIDSFVARADIDQRFFDNALLHHPQRSGRAGCLCGDQGGNAQQGHGGARPHRAGEARAGDRA
jgi:DNA end-binding protein Ku